MDFDALLDQAIALLLFHLGEFSTAQAHLEQSLTLYDSQRLPDVGPRLARKGDSRVHRCYRR